LRQYEDISRVTILFSPSEPGEPAKEPIDTVSTENTYYKQAYYRALGEPAPSTFEIWPGETTILTNHTIASIEGRICPEPLTSPDRTAVFDPDTSAIIDPGSDVQITYFIASPDGTEEERSELLDSSKELCSQRISRSFVLDIEGIWSVYATATWVTLNNYTRTDSTREIESDVIILAVSSNQVQDCASVGTTPEECDEDIVIRTEQLEECNKLGIDGEDCTDISILQRSQQQTNERKAIEETKIQVNNAMYMIGIGAAIAGVFAFITLRKTK